MINVISVSPQDRQAVFVTSPITFIEAGTYLSIKQKGNRLTTGHNQYVTQIDLTSVKEDTFITSKLPVGLQKKKKKRTRHFDLTYSQTVQSDYLYDDR